MLANRNAYRDFTDFHCIGSTQHRQVIPESVINTLVATWQTRDFTKVSDVVNDVIASGFSATQIVSQVRCLVLGLKKAFKHCKKNSGKSCDKGSANLHIMHSLINLPRLLRPFSSTTT